MKWIVFDGPVDAIWIEDMNSVLDDSMLLCLGNGERIKLNLSMRIMIECEDLIHASLATVSRAGIIWVPEETIGWKVYIESFLRNTFLNRTQKKLFTAECVTYILDLFNNYYPPLINWYRNKVFGVEGAEPIPTTEMQQI